MKRFLSGMMSLVLIISLCSIPVNASSASDLANSTSNVVGKSCTDLGLPSSGWCGYFVGYCINKSSVSSLAGEQISRANCANAMTLINWICAVKNVGTYYSLSSPHYNRLTNAYKNLSIVSSSVDNYEPAVGDIIVFDWNGRGDSNHIFSHVGIVTSYNKGSARVTHVDGNTATGNYRYVAEVTHARTYSGIIGYIRLKEGQTNGSLVSSTPTVATTYADCNVEIACVNGQTVNLYNNPGDTSRVTYFNKGQIARSTYRATLSDGSTWYRVGAVHNGTDRMFWLKYESSKMKVTPISTQYTVTFNPAGGNVSATSIKVTNGSTYGSLPTPTKNGYTFDGWYTAQSGGSRITGSTSVNLTGNQTLYAHWTASPTKYTVTLNPMGGSLSTSSITVENDSTYGALPTPTRDGYNFDGWYTAQSGGEWIKGSTGVNLTGNQTLYAHWSLISTEAQESDVSSPHAHVKNTGTKMTSGEHPHYLYYKCKICGEWFTENETAEWDSCQICNPSKEPTWSDWSEWSSTWVSSSPTRRVESREVEVTPAHTEYRYARYVDSTGKHDCWCAKYLEGLSYISGKASLQYSEWTTTLYGTSGKSWTCGNCNGTHIGVDHKTSDGRSWWPEYFLPSGSYYWYETRQVAGTYERQYRYSDLISG